MMRLILRFSCYCIALYFVYFSERIPSMVLVYLCVLSVRVCVFDNYDSDDDDDDNDENV